MSCGLMIAAALMLTDPTVAAASAVTPSAETPVAGESLFLDIVSRSQTLKGVVDGWIETGFDAAAFAGFRQAPRPWPRWTCRATSPCATAMWTAT
ncbi:hypothetical protein [Brevundimonas denitrificans]|uniref:hypothetical protein n=1 Tax=Brevundimonas denitrificans TaxID=1443434 RepID=UPI00223C1E74|nr:hypothetical protein [Brevundimonas denitrificans]